MVYFNLEEGVDRYVFEKNGVAYLNGKVTFQGVSLNVYSFVLDGVLIDTGARSLAKHFEHFIAGSDVDQVRLTHFHEDHTGCAAYVEKNKNIPIYISKKSIDICAKPATYPLYRQFFWGKRKPFHAKPMPKTFTSRQATWDAIETPGHAYDHHAFLNRETGQLFTGDLYVSEKTKVILAEENIPTIIRSLEHVLTYDFQDVFCNHRGFVKDGRLALERKLNNLLALQQEVLLLQQKGNPADVICRQIFPRKYPITKFSNGEWDSIHIVTSIMNES